MPSCQLCGKEEDQLTKIKTEGTKLNVCKDCEDVGKQISQPSQKTKTGKKHKKARNRSETVLAPDYGERVKKARENAGYNQEELSDKVNEKESRIGKIEREELKPDEKLGKKLEAELKIDLYVTPEVDNIRSETGSDDRSATLGDVADVEES